MPAFERFAPRDRHGCMRHSGDSFMSSCVRPIDLLSTLIVALMSLTCGVTVAADSGARRKVIIDQDAFGPAGSNMQAILLLLQSKDVEVLGITIPSGDGWRDE